MSRPVKTRLRWYWWLVVAAFAGGLFLFHAVGLGVAFAATANFLWQSPKAQARFWVRGFQDQLAKTPELPAKPGRPSAKLAPILATNAAALRVAGEFFQPSNVWDIHLSFRSNEWAALEPKRVPPVLDFIRSDGPPLLRNPDASRAGLAGILGVDLPWSRGDVRVGDAVLTNVAARFKGNGTFVASVRGYKRPFKLDLNDFVPEQRLAGRHTLNLHNLAADRTYLCDTLACEFFRAAGLPAPRTAFARVRLTVEGRFEDRLLGLYVLVENPDSQWAREQFGVPGVALFKPVTPDLFADLGDDWAEYEPIYDPKTKVTPAQQRRLIALVKLVSQPDDARFADRIGELVDLPEFARFLAGQVLLANYDSILSNGQNFLLYLDPRTDRFGFIPWDHDHSWGQFGLIGSAQDRAHASIRQPWLGENRFLGRMMQVPEVRQLYEAELKRLREELFQPERLSRRLDELVARVRPLIAEESSLKLFEFDAAVAAPRPAGSQTNAFPGFRQSLPLKEFFATRAASVDAQLAGREEGVVLQRRGLR